jgi:hypothetical protein
MIDEGPEVELPEVVDHVVVDAKNEFVPSLIRKLLVSVE